MKAKKPDLNQRVEDCEFWDEWPPEWQDEVRGLTVGQMMEKYGWKSVEPFRFDFPQMTIVPSKGRPLVDWDRLREVQEVFLVDGGEIFDLFGIRYGDSEIIIRVRDEFTQDCEWFRPAPGQSMEEGVAQIMQTLQRDYEVGLEFAGIQYVGRRARQYLKRTNDQAIAQAEARELKTGDTLELEGMDLRILGGEERQ